ncbi:putative lipoprotein [Actinosynnema pretiosum subsp. pretiosum]|nr:putative lipoprotein [Actinosynnema pretiosum subsp. pretiosum]
MVVGVVALGLLVGCSGGGTPSMAPAKVAPDEGGVQGIAPQRDPARQDPARQDSAGNGQQVPEQPGEVLSGRDLVRTADVDLVSGDVDGVVARVKAAAEERGGFVASESSTGQRGTAVVRVPGERFEDFLGALGGLDGASVERREVRTEDVTEQVVDVQARLTTQRASVERIRALLDRAGSTAEIAQIEGELTRRQAELESLQGRLESLKGRVALSTVTVVVRTEPGKAAPDGPPGFLDALRGGWDALVVALAFVLAALGAALPFLVVLAIPVAALVAWRRRRRRTAAARRSGQAVGGGRADPEAGSGASTGDLPGDRGEPAAEQASVPPKE